MTGVFVVVDHRQRVAIVDEFQRRGEVLARNLAAISYGPLLLYNYTALQQNVTQAAAEDDVRYALVLDADGKVAVHSGHPERVGSAMEGAVPARAAAAGEPLIQESVTSRGESIYDFAVPVRVEGRKWGTIRVGLSKQRMDAEIRKTRLELGALTNGIVTVGLDGRVVTLNPAAELLTGFFKGEVSGRYCSEIFAHTPAISDILMETLASRAPITGVNLTLRRRNGSAMPVEFSTAPLKGGEGKDLGVIGVLRDLTLVRRLESDLRRSDRLAALGTLAAGLAHEIKNPLTALVTFSRHLERKFDDVRFRERFQSVVPHELERINAIVERLLELARPARMNVALVRLPGLLDRVAELYANQIEAQQIEVVREYGRDVPP